MPYPPAACSMRCAQTVLLCRQLHRRGAAHQHPHTVPISTSLVANPEHTFRSFSLHLGYKYVIWPTHTLFVMCKLCVGCVGYLQQVTTEVALNQLPHMDKMNVSWQRKLTLGPAPPALLRVCVERWRNILAAKLAKGASQTHQQQHQLGCNTSSLDCGGCHEHTCEEEVKEKGPLGVADKNTKRKKKSENYD